MSWFSDVCFSLILVNVSYFLSYLGYIYINEVRLGVKHRINKFVEAHSYHFTPLDSLHDNVTDTDDNNNLVADVDPDTLIRIVRPELKNGKALGIDNACLQRHSQEGNRYRILQTFGSSLYHIIKTGFYPTCTEGSSPLYAH